MGRYLIGAGVALVIAYIGYPYLTIWQLNQAVNAKYEATLESLVDWESLEYGLEQDLEGLFERPDPTSNDPMDELAESLLGIFSDFLVDPIVAFYASPEGLAYLLNTQVILEDPGEVLEEDFPAEDTWYDHIAFAFFQSPAEFRVTVRYPEARGKGRSEDEPMVLVFRLQHFKWQLTRVHLPLESIAD
jgi:hypothetical protein